MRRLPSALLLASLLLGTAGPARGAPPSSPYAPAPAGFAALVGSPEEEASAARAVAAIDAASPAEGRRARDDLVGAGPAGVRAAALALAAGEPSPAAELRLLEVLAASSWPEVDAVLSRAARRPRFEVRALAAHALGAGRSAGAVETLTVLSRDDVPAVRGSAVRALFAIESPAAEAARAALPIYDAETTALRLRLHRLRGDEHPAVAALAFSTWVSSPSPIARGEAARCLSLPGLAAPPALLAWVVLEAGGVPLALPLAPARPLEPGAGRLAAAEALTALIARADLSPAARRGWLTLGASWIAHPLRVGAMRVDGLARDRLLEALPDAGADLVEPVTTLLLAKAFDDPQEGAALLAGLEESIALPALRALADPRGTTPEPVVIAAAAKLRDLGRLGDADVGAAILDRCRSTDLRTDGVRALRRDPPAIALPLLASVVSDVDEAVASEAAKVLLDRPEPEARAAVEAALLDARWQQHEYGDLRTLVAKATPADWDFLDRAIAQGPAGLRDAVFDALRYPRSGLRGPRGVALVHAAQAMLAAKKPGVRLGFDEGSIARALCAVAPEEGVAFIRSKWRGGSIVDGKWVGPDSQSLAFLRNLQTVKLASAGEFALEVAAGVPDTDAVTLGIVTTVLGGECEKDPERLDAFWRRCLLSKDEQVVSGALTALTREADRPNTPAGRAAPVRPRFARKPLEPLLLAILDQPAKPAPGVRAEGFDPETRIAALKALTLEPAPNAEDLLRALAFDGTEDDSVRLEAAEALVSRAEPATREAALAWLEAPSSDASGALRGIARTAGRGASPAGAARLLAMLEAAIAKKFASPPYWRPSEMGDVTDERIEALCDAIGETRDPATLDAVAKLLFDPRFAQFSAETLRAQWLGFVAGGGPLSPLFGPAPFPTQLRRAKTNTAEELPVAAAPPVVQALRTALCAEGPEAAAARLVRAVRDARATGRLARFPDAYLTAIARQMRSDDGGRSLGTARREGAVDFGAAAEALEGALSFTFPAGTAEEVYAAAAPVLGHLRAGRFEAAARAQTAAIALAARTGLCDVEPGPLSQEEATRLPSWRRLRAARDGFEGAAAAAAGKPEEARDAFARAVRRTRDDSETLRLLADLRAVLKFDLAAAEADARRALVLRVRRIDRDTAVFRRTLANVLRLEGKPDAARRVLEGVTAEDSED